MSCIDISFQTSDNVTLRGWIFKPQNLAPGTKLPCLVLVHGYTCVKEMGLSEVALSLVSALPLTCLVYDHRGFGGSDTLPCSPRQEIIPAQQCSDLRDALTYAQIREEVNQDRIGVWGYSFGGGHALVVAAVDRRVKALITLAPFVDGWENFHIFAPPHVLPGMNQGFQADRINRAAGNPATTLPVVAENPASPCALPSPESFKFFSAWENNGSSWKNEVTLRSVEEARGYTLPVSHLKHITPTPVFMVINTKDTNTPPEMGFRAYGKLSEPKELCILDGNHYEMLGRHWESYLGKQVSFLQRTLCVDIAP